MNGALDELKKALIQSVENSENSNMDRQAVQKYFDKEIEPIRVKTDIAIQKVIDSADRRVLIIQESTDEKLRPQSLCCCDRSVDDRDCYLCL